MNTYSLNQEELSALRSYVGDDLLSNQFLQFLRFLGNKVVYSSAMYTRAHKRISSVIQYKDSDMVMYGQVQCYIK